MYDICRKAYFLFREQIVHQLGCQNDNADHNENHQYTDTHVPQVFYKGHGVKIQIDSSTCQKIQILNLPLVWQRSWGDIMDFDLSCRTGSDRIFRFAYRDRCSGDRFRRYYFGEEPLADRHNCDNECQNQHHGQRHIVRLGVLCCGKYQYVLFSFSLSYHHHRWGCRYCSRH